MKKSCLSIVAVAIILGVFFILRAKQKSDYNESLINKISIPNISDKIAVAEALRQGDVTGICLLAVGLAMAISCYMK